MSKKTEVEVAGKKLIVSNLDKVFFRGGETLTASPVVREV